MDLSELSSSSGHAPSGPGSAPVGAGPADGAWQVAALVGSEVAQSLTSVLDQVRALQATGRIDRLGLHALASRVEQARRASMVGQQIARLARGGTQQQHESLSLTQMLRDAMAARQDDLGALGIAVAQANRATDVMADPTLLSALLNAVLDWSVRHARSAVEFRLDTKAWPAHPRLTCRFRYVPADQVQPDPAPTHAALPLTPTMDCLSWQLVVHLARTMQLLIDRVDSGGQTELTLEFPQTANDSLEGASSIEVNTAFALAGDSRPLAGSHVLVIAPRRDVRNQVRQAVAHMGLAVDFVSAVDAAREFCAQGLPQAIVYEAGIYDGRFDALRAELRGHCPELAWIEIADHGAAFEVSGFGGTAVARVARDALTTALPAALMFELAKGR